MQYIRVPLSQTLKGPIISATTELAGPPIATPSICIKNFPLKFNEFNDLKKKV